MHHDNSSPVRGGTRWRNRFAVTASMLVGLAAVAVGLTLFLTTGNSASFGWFAYAPLSSATFSPLSPLMTQQGLLGMLVGILGLLVLAFAAGWAFGRRPTTDRA